MFQNAEAVFSCPSVPPHNFSQPGIFIATLFKSKLCLKSYMELALMIVSLLVSWLFVLFSVAIELLLQYSVDNKCEIQFADSFIELLHSKE